MASTQSSSCYLLQLPVLLSHYRSNHSETITTLDLLSLNIIKLYYIQVLFIVDQIWLSLFVWLYRWQLCIGCQTSFHLFFAVSLFIMIQSFILPRSFSRVTIEMARKIALLGLWFVTTRTWPITLNKSLMPSRCLYSCQSSKKGKRRTQKKRKTQTKARVLFRWALSSFFSTKQCVDNARQQQQPLWKVAE